MTALLTWMGGTLFGWVLACLTPLAQEKLTRRFYGPHLKVEFGKGDPYRFETPCVAAENGYVLRRACYLRVRVVNEGSKVARKCRGYLTKVEWKNGEVFEVAPFYDSIPLIWSYKGKDQG